jgi:hypothetical protein
MSQDGRNPSAFGLENQGFRNLKVFAQDLFGGADPTHRLPVRVVTEFAWHSLFIQHLLIVPNAGQREGFAPEFTIIDLPASRPIRRFTAAKRERDRGQFHPQDRADRRHVLCRRDEEVGVHDAELSPAAQARDADALLGQCRQQRRRRDLLRPVRHRQDDAVRRSERAR